MREDLEDVMYDTGSYGGHGKSKCARAWLHREDPEALPTRIPMGARRQYGYECKQTSYRCAPLNGFLEKSVGRPWADVWHDICAVTDARSFRGHEIRRYVKLVVDTDPHAPYFGLYFSGFYVDFDGILRYIPRDSKKEIRRHWVGRKPTTYISTPDPDFHYEKVDGFWYSFETIHIKEGYAEQFLVEVNGEVEIRSAPVKEFWRHETVKKQVNAETASQLEDEARRQDIDWINAA
jgi:hypothetical protein